MADGITRTHFNDGEGLDEADLNRLQSLLDAKNMQRAANIGRMGAAEDMGHFTGSGPLTNGGAELAQNSPASISASLIYTPSPLGFVNSTFDISGAGNLGFDFGPLQVMQGSGGSTPGTPADGYVSGMLSYIMEDEEISLFVARPSVNPRYDSINLRLGHAAPNNPDARDFEDAGTRALTTTNPNKDQATSMESELVQGTEAASPVFPAPTAGFARFITIFRETGETSLDPDNVRWHSLPMNLKTEIVIGDEGWFSAGWAKPVTRPGSIEKSGAGSATIQFFPRTMSAGSRLVGVGICFQNTGIDVDDIKLQRMEYDVDGNQTQVDLVNLGAGGPLSSSEEGFNFAGLPEFDDADGNDLPIWGNGRTYGPLLGTHADAGDAKGLADSTLILHVADTAWAGGENILYVKFYYLE